MGIVCYSQNNYTSFIKRSNEWEIHNDLMKKVKKASFHTLISITQLYMLKYEFNE